MGTPSREIDQWRDYFRTADSDIFEIIERAILVAATDCPDELKLRRLRIAELLFTARLSRCAQCNRVELSVPEFGENGGVRCEFEATAGGSKESKANSSRDDQTDGNLNPASNYSYGDAEALTNEMEEEDQILGEVLRIQEILKNYQDEPDSALFDSLRRLQLMGLTITILKVTEIGKTVNALRRHGSKQTRHLARSLILEWKAVVDEWVHAGQETGEPAGSEGTPDSVNPTVVDGDDEEAGLPSPPLDEGAFFTTQSIDFAEFFDGMDDDGNPRNNMGEFNKNRESGRKPPMVKQNVSKQREVPLKEGVVLSKDNNAQRLKPPQSVPKSNNRPLNTASGPGRPLKPHGEQKVKPVVKAQDRADKPTIPRKTAPRLEVKQKKPRASNEDLVQVKLEAAKRKLQERYQEAQNAKKQRTIQVMELHELPKQGLGQRNMQGKFGNNFNRNWANGRR